MTKVYPNAANVTAIVAATSSGIMKPSCVTSDDHGKSLVLTVWKKSLLFNCDGFTVYDARGNLVYRVDNYSAGTKGEIILMDASGNSLLTIRRKRLSLTDNWLVYDGDTVVKPILSAKKYVNLLNSNSLAYVTSGCSSTGTGGAGSPSNKKVLYEIQGSFVQRCCAVYDENRNRVAEIKRKEAVAGGVAFGNDVFRLVVQPGIDSTVAMALVILLDQMFGSSKLRFSH